MARTWSRVGTVTLPSWRWKSSGQSQSPMRRRGKATYSTCRTSALTWTRCSVYPSSVRCLNKSIQDLLRPGEGKKRGEACGPPPERASGLKGQLGTSVSVREADLFLGPGKGDSHFSPTPP